MKYKFSEKADKSLSRFSRDKVRRILDFLEEAAEEEFYNHDSYSYIYDHHGRPWDKLDMKREDLNYRIFFKEIDGNSYILEIFDRDELDYEDRGLYSLLKKVERKIDRN